MAIGMFRRGLLLDIQMSEKLMACLQLVQTYLTWPIQKRHLCESDLNYLYCSLWSLADCEQSAQFIVTCSIHLVLLDLLRDINASGAPIRAGEGTHESLDGAILNTVKNLSEWEGCKSALLGAGIVDVMQGLRTLEGKPGVNDRMNIAATLAYLVGGQEDKDQKLLVSQPAVLATFCEALDSAMTKQGAYWTYSVKEVLLAIRNLSVSDLNKPHLGTKQNIENLIFILKKPASTQEELDLSSNILLQFSFDPSLLAALKESSSLRLFFRGKRFPTIVGPARRNLQQLQWTIDGSAPPAPAPPPPSAAAGGPRNSAPGPPPPAPSAPGSVPRPADGHVMISYSWAHQVFPII